MNNRDYKIFAEGEIFHIYNRGVGKMDIFLDDEDYLFFLKRLKEALYPELMAPINQTKIDGRHQNQVKGYMRKQLPAGSFSLLAYVLMPNHFHFIIRQNGNVSLSKLISKLLTGYSKNFNRKNSRVGSVFQDRFKAVNIDSDEYLRWISAYVHNNPKVAGLVADLKDYPWSSYPDYAGLRNGVLCKKDIILESFKDVAEYIEFVESSCEIIKGRKDMDDLLLDD